MTGKLRPLLFGFGAVSSDWGFEIIMPDIIAGVFDGERGLRLGLHCLGCEGRRR